jgi:molybdate transport system ATP-binding protein
LIELDILIRRDGYRLEAAFTSQARVTGLIGPSGSGKTTLLSALAGILRPVSGRIAAPGGRVYFDSARGVDVPVERRRLGVVFQENLLFPNLNVRDNLLFGYRRTPPDERRLQPEEICSLLDLRPLLERSTAALSGGEARRVAIGRALLTSPVMLLLDEPLTGLDGPLRDRVLAYLLRLKQELSIPMIFISHRFQDVFCLAGSVALLEVEHSPDGTRTARVAAQGEPHAVLAEAEKVVGSGPLETIIPGTVIESGAGSGCSLVQGQGLRMHVASSHAPGARCYVTLRADEIILARQRPPALSSRNVWKGSVLEVKYLEHTTVVTVDVGAQISVEVTREAVRELELIAGADVYAIVKARSLRTVELGGSIEQTAHP